MDDNGEEGGEVGGTGRRPSTTVTATVENGTVGNSYELHVRLDWLKRVIEAAKGYAAQRWRFNCWAMCQQNICTVIIQKKWKSIPC